jgi:hypothetical protein
MAAQGMTACRGSYRLQFSFVYCRGDVWLKTFKHVGLSGGSTRSFARSATCLVQCAVLRAGRACSCADSRSPACRFDSSTPASASNTPAAASTGANPPAPVDVNNASQLQQQLTSPTTATSTAVAISHALASAGNDCNSGPGQALARE